MRPSHSQAAAPREGADIVHYTPLEGTEPGRTLREARGGFVRRVLDAWWAEWFAHCHLVLVFLIGWLAAVWLLPLVASPLWLLGFGTVFALVAAPAFGGGDVIHGCEEFMLGLPPTRNDRFLARLTFAGACLLLFSVMTLAAIGLNLPDVLDRVFLNTGLTQTVQLREPSLLYGLVIAFPFAIFSFSFAISTLARSRAVAFTAWLWGSMIALGILRLGIELEEWRWDRLNGRVTVPLLVLLSLLVLTAAWRLFIRKEAGSDAAPLRIPLSWWGWLLAVIVGGTIVAALIAWLAATFARFM